VASTTVLLRQRTHGTEAARILDRLESVTGLGGERVEGGRSYDLGESDLIVAMASIRGHLDSISATWPMHVQLEVDPKLSGD
jgi:hypothetical protein